MCDEGRLRGADYGTTDPSQRDSSQQPPAQPPNRGAAAPAYSISHTPIQGSSVWSQRGSTGPLSRVYSPTLWLRRRYCTVRPCAYIAPARPHTRGGVLAAGAESAHSNDHQPGPRFHRPLFIQVGLLRLAACHDRSWADSNSGGAIRGRRRMMPRCWWRRCRAGRSPQPTTRPLTQTQRISEWKSRLSIDAVLACFRLDVAGVAGR